MSNLLTLITGSSGGMATSLAKLLQKQGHQLILVTRNIENLDKDLRDNHFAITSDVSQVDAANMVMQKCINQFGRAPDNLAHLAGSVVLNPIHRISDEDYHEALDANMHSTFYTVRAYIDTLIRQKQAGNIALVSSVAAQIGIANHEVIAMAKGAIDGLVRSVAASYSNKGIRINAIAPGLMRSPANEKFFINESAEKSITAQYPLGRYGNVDDAANAISWLLSPQSDWITGQITPVDGGLSAVRPLIKI
jgi:NAD(P)-dependent dehydrogenase (short-subunit alcohol dehydrogenase family)